VKDVPYKVGHALANFNINNRIMGRQDGTQWTSMGGNVQQPEHRQHVQKQREIAAG
jgi:hypothetical protein